MKELMNVILGALFIIVATSMGCADAESERSEWDGLNNGETDPNDGSQDRTDSDPDEISDDGENRDDSDEKETGAGTGTESDSGKVGGDSDVDADTDEEVETEQEADTAFDDAAPPCAKYDYDKNSYDYGAVYAKGPYGFKGSMCWDMAAGEGRWTNFGDVIHDICLPNQDGQEVCLGEYYDAGYNLLIIEVSAIDCPACAAEARDEARILQKLENSYWKAAWVTIMGRSLSGSLPKVSTAASWKSQYGLGGQVLADTKGTWEQRMFFDKWPADERGGVPLTFLVNPSNMVIWDAFAGWTDAAGFDEFAKYIVDLAVYCSSNDLR